MSTYRWTGTGAWNTTTNWTPNGTPTTNDHIVFDADSGEMTAGPSGNPVLASVRIKQSCPRTSYIGSPSSPIAAAVTLFIVGEETLDGNNNDGCRRICWNFGGTRTGYSGTQVVIHRTASTGLAGLEVLQLAGTHTDNKVYVQGSSLVGLGVMSPGQSFTLLNIVVTDSQAKVRLGSGGTVDTITQTDGFILAECGATTLEQDAGQIRSEGTGAFTNANVGGVFVSNATGTVANLDVDDGGLADFSQSSQERAVTNPTIHGTGRINARTAVPRAVTFTNPIQCVDGAYSNQVDLGTDVAVGQNALS